MGLTNGPAVSALTKILQAAHAGELAAANAYAGHWRTLRDPIERAEVRRIEEAELHHRRVVATLMVELGARPQRWREVLMGSIGRFFGFLCRCSGWFLPMYMAGRLEAMNVLQYATAADLARTAGLSGFVDEIEAMVQEEVRHERWFSERVTGHWLLPLASALFAWRPSTPVSSPSSP